MTVRTQVLGIALAMLMLVLVLELVRRRRLRVGYSLTWLLIGAGTVLLIAVPPLLTLVTRLLGMTDPRSLLFTAGIAFAFWLLLDHSLTLTKLWRQDKELTQQHALLEWRMRELETQLDELTEAHLTLLEAQNREMSVDGLGVFGVPADGSFGQEVGRALNYQLEDGYREPKA